MDPILRVDGLAKTYSGEGVDVPALRGVDLEITPGDFVAVAGPSGCGKSTLLNLLGGLDRCSSGTIEFEGRRVDGLDETAWARLRRARIGFVFQFFNLVATLTARENVELPLLLVGHGRSDARRRADDLLERLGVADRADASPSHLSGGQQQRVALARAIANEPAVLLADEPTGNLDSRSAREVMALLREANEAGQTLVLVTHDPRIAAAADRVVTMRDGLIIDETTLDEHRPAAAILSDVFQIGGER